MKYLTQVSWPVALVLSAIALALWIPSFLAPGAACGLITATLLLTVLNAVVIMALFYNCGVTRYRSGLPVVVYLLLMAAFPSAHTDWQGQLVILLFAPVAYLLHGVHLNPESQECSFLATLLICFASLFQPVAVWLIPMLWLGFILQQAFSLRSFLASVMAILVSIIYVGGICWLVDYLGYQLWLSIPDFSFAWIAGAVPFLSQIRFYVLLAVTIGFTIPVLLSIERVSTREGTFSVIYALLFFTALLIALMQCHTPTINPLPVYAAAVLATLFFRQRESVVRGVIFLCFIALTIASALL